MPTNTFLKSILCMLFFSVNVFSQDSYQAIVLNPDLQSNANAIVRSSTIDVSIEARDKIVITEQRVVTVLNERGQRHVGAVVYYDQSKSIKTLEAVVFNAFGKEIKKFKKKDFIDVSVADGVSIFTDNRARYIDYTPVSYPYTVVFNLEQVSSNTAFIPQWFPIDDYYLSVEKASYKIQNQTDIPLDF